MPRRPLSDSMTADQVVAHQRERNRRKQRAFKERQKAAKLAQQVDEDDGDDRDGGGGTSSSPSRSAHSDPSTSSPQAQSAPSDQVTIERLSKRLAELQDLTRQLKKAKAGLPTEEGVSAGHTDGLGGCEHTLPGRTSPE